MVAWSDFVDLRDELHAVTPRLRRYARALATGSPAPSPLADDLVHATLLRALAAPRARASDELTVRLYATVTQLNREMAEAGRTAVAAGAGRATLVGVAKPTVQGQTKLTAGLLSLTLDAREALLLVALEGFGHGEAARILRISRAALIGRLTVARTGLDAFMKASPAAAPTRTVPHLRLVN